MELIHVHEHIGDQFLVDFHVFMLLHGGFQINVCKIYTTVLSTGSGQDAVPQYLACYEVCCGSADIEGVVDKITANGNSDTLGVLLLGSIVCNYPSICDGAVGGDVSYLIFTHKENCVGSISVLFVSLGQTPKLFAHCEGPYFFGGWIRYKGFI
eukprot:267963-Ditylum_brightwellii.AAC.1